VRVRARARSGQQAGDVLPGPRVERAAAAGGRRSGRRAPSQAIHGLRSPVTTCSVSLCGWRQDQGCVEAYRAGTEARPDSKLLRFRFAVDAVRRPPRPEEGLRQRAVEPRGLARRRELPAAARPVRGVGGGCSGRRRHAGPGGRGGAGPASLRRRRGEFRRVRETPEWNSIEAGLPEIPD